MNDSIISVKDVSKSFHVRSQDVPVLTNISFEIKPKDFLIIFGPSGCGKSTLLHTILGLEEPTNGNISFLGKNLYEDLTEDERSDFRKQHIGMVYQQSNWIRCLNTLENVAFPLTLLGKERTVSLIKAGQMLRLVKMDRWVNYFPMELSSGQQQKVSLSRALVTDPEIIIADEPTGNLDYESAQELMEMLALLNKQGKTILMVTHDLNYLKFARRAIRMFNGRIVGIYEENQKRNLLKSIKEKRTEGKLSHAESNFAKIAVNPEDINTTVAQQISSRHTSRTTRQGLWLPKLFLQIIVSVTQRLGFLLLLAIYLCDRFLLKGIRPGKAYYWALHKTIDLLDASYGQSISRLDLIELAISNIMIKRARMLVTIGGMMLGIGTIVFLVSIGYGLQQLVVTRVARLEEMKQADVTPQTGGKIKINDKTLSDFRDIPAAQMSLPLIEVVGRVNYQNSVSDMAVYGVTTDYLKQSAIKPVEGKIFDSNELVSNIKYEVANIEEVAGLATEKKIDFHINPRTWIRIREGPSTTAKILGFTKQTEGNSTGTEIWGGRYESDNNAGRAGESEDGEVLGKWIKAPVLLWKEEKCDSQTHGNCDDGKYIIMRDENNKQIQKTGFFAEINLTVAGANIKQNRVMGITSDASVDWVEIASEAGIISPPETRTIELNKIAKRQAVVNRAMLKILGLSEKDAVGKKFDVSFVIIGDLLTNANEKVESAPSGYTIIGVTPEEKTPFLFVPFIDLRSLGITNYSQVKVVAKSQSQLAKIRKQIEAMGFVTRSVADTVEQINSFFATVRTILMLLGMAALAVAALGMFNTLTVSLLERTREVGLMKAMGMKSSEVQELFLTESIIMGFFGGILGILLGFVTGKLLSLALTLLAIFKGVGFIDISYIPFDFIIAIIFFSLIVGIFTGIYPARRATKISALNALRYE